MVLRNCINTWVVPTTNNEITQPAQPAFLGYLASNNASLTGDGTVFILGDTDVASALTEIFDQNSDFVSGSATGAIFTAPVTGRYYLSVGIFAYGYDTTQTRHLSQISTTLGAYRLIDCNPTNIKDANNYLIVLGGILCDMDAADTAFIYVTDTGGNKSVGCAAAARTTVFNGYLVV
jgi:hypothetical protein